MDRIKEVNEKNSLWGMEIQIPPEFDILEEIGEGKRSKVYLASHKATKKKVALKFIPFPYQYSPKKFMMKMGHAASLRHFGTVKIWQIGFLENFIYFIMEYVEGKSLETKKLDTNEKEVWSIVLQICQVLQQALKKNIIHGNIKPSNFLLDQENKVKLSDFELTKNLNEINISLSQEKTFFSSPYYVSPEQASYSNIDFRSDIYSLGASIYHILTKQPLFSEKSDFEIIYKQKNTPPLSPEKIVPTISLESCFILAKMLHKDPKKRYQSYGDLIFDIHALQKKQSLVFATSNDYIDAYRQNITSLKSKFIQSAKESPTSNILKENKIVIVSSPQEIYLETPSFFHFVDSILELKSYLQNNNSLVILDSHYLEDHTLAFLSFLKEEFPHSHLQILSKNILSDPELSKNLPLLSYKGWEKKVVSKKRGNSLPVYEIKLKSIMKLAQSFYWNGNFYIYSKASRCGQIIISNGEVVQSYYKDKEGKKILSFILKQDYEWKFSPQRVTKIEKRLQENRLIIEEMQQTNYSLQTKTHPLENRKRAKLPIIPSKENVDVDIDVDIEKQRKPLSAPLPINFDNLGKSTKKSKVTSKRDIKKMPKETKSILSGDLSEISLWEILQILSSKKKTGCLSVTNKDEKTYTYLEKGFIVNYQSSTGSDICNFFLQYEGDFLFEPMGNIPEKQFKLSIEDAKQQANRAYNKS